MNNLRMVAFQEKKHDDIEDIFHIGFCCYSVLYLTYRRDVCRSIIFLIMSTIGAFIKHFTVFYNRYYIGIKGHNRISIKDSNTHFGRHNYLLYLCEMKKCFI